jgi:hypothetical protein
MAKPVYLGWEAAHNEKNTISSYIVTRLSLVSHIRKQCESMYAHRITFADGFSLVGGNLAEGSSPMNVRSIWYSNSIPALYSVPIISTICVAR